MIDIIPKQRLMKPWADPNHESYSVSRKPGKHCCLGCRKPCTYTAWGPWCHPCNVERMTDIDKAMAGIARDLGNEKMAREFEAD